MTEINDLILVEKDLFLVDQTGDLLVGKSLKVPLFTVGIVEKAFRSHLFDLAERLVEEGDGLVLFWVVEDDVSALFFLQSGDTFQKFLLTIAGNARDAKDLPAVDGEGNVVHRVDAVTIFDRQVFDDQSRLGVDGVLPIDVEVKFLADHHFGKRFFIGFGSFHRSDMLALS